MIGERAPIVEKPPPFANHPAFIETMAAYARDVLARLGVAPSRTRLVFTGHPIPTAMAAACDYEAELLEASTLVAERVALTRPPHDLALQSRSRPPAS